MKTIAITMMSFILPLMMGSVQLKANNPNPEKMYKILDKEISYPEFAKKQNLDGVVLVNFTLHKDGTISVNLTNESDANLKNYVVNKLKNLKVRGKIATDKNYNVKFEFKSKI